MARTIPKDGRPLLDIFTRLTNDRLRNCNWLPPIGQFFFCQPIRLRPLLPPPGWDSRPGLPWLESAPRLISPYMYKIDTVYQLFIWLTDWLYYSGLINFIGIKAKCCHLKNWPLKEVLGRCLSELIDWRYSQACWIVGIFDRALYTVAPLSLSLVQLSPSSTSLCE